jgi:hypothetical protein
MTPEQFASQAAAWAQYPLVMIMVGTLFFIIRYWAQDRKEWLEFIKHMSDSHTQVLQSYRDAQDKMISDHQQVQNQLLITLQQQQIEERKQILNHQNETISAVLDNTVDHLIDGVYRQEEIRRRLTKRDTAELDPDHPRLREMDRRHSRDRERDAK